MLQCVLRQTRITLNELCATEFRPFTPHSDVDHIFASRNRISPERKRHEELQMVFKLELPATCDTMLHGSMVLFPSPSNPLPGDTDSKQYTCKNTIKTDDS